MDRETFECHKCGHKWRKGQHGGHDCSVLLKERIQELEAAIREYRDADFNDLGFEGMRAVEEKLWSVLDNKEEG